MAQLEEKSKCDDSTGMQLSRPFPSLVERYYTPFYKVNLPSGTIDLNNLSTNRNDVRVLWHSNKICVLTLASSHFALAPDRKIAEVSFQVTTRCDRASNKVSGKRKRGAQWLNSNSPVCIITMGDGEIFTVYSGIRGNLIEVNELLVKSPDLLMRKPETNGYIAIIMIKLQERDRLKEELLDESRYWEYVKRLDIAS